MSPGRTGLDKCMCCNTEIKVADQAYCQTQSQRTYTGQPLALTLTRQVPGRVTTRVQFVQVTGITRRGKAGIDPSSPALEAVWFGGCSTSQQHASLSQEQISSDDCTCCHTEIQVADQTFYLTQSQYTDTGPTSPRRLKCRFF